MALTRRQAILGGLATVLAATTGCASGLNPFGPHFGANQVSDDEFKRRLQATAQRNQEIYPGKRDYPLQFPVYGPQNLEHCTWGTTPIGRDVTPEEMRGYQRSGRAALQMLIPGAESLDAYKTWWEKQNDELPLSQGLKLHDTPSYFDQSQLQVDLSRPLDDTVRDYVRKGLLAVVPRIRDNDTAYRDFSEIKQRCDDAARTKAYKMCDKPVVEIEWNMDSEGSRKTISAFCQAAAELKDCAVFCFPGYGDRFNACLSNYAPTPMRGDFHPIINIYDPRADRNEENMRSIATFVPPGYTMPSVKDVEALYLAIKSAVLAATRK